MTKVKVTTQRSKPVRCIRATLIVIFDTGSVHVPQRVMAWEDAARTGRRHVHRVEHAGPIDGSGMAYLVDLEMECKGANRHDFTKFVRSYLPEATHYFITD